MTASNDRTIRRVCVVGLALLLCASACSRDDESPAPANPTTAAPTATTEIAETPAVTAARERRGLLRLQDPLDEPEYYCIDVPGLPDPDLDLESDLWAHTCKPGAAADQVFTVGFRERQILLDGYDRCLTVRERTPGAALAVVDCADPTLQGWDLDDEGILRLLSPGPVELCVAVAEGPGAVVNEPESHVALDLTVEDCAGAPAERARWEVADATSVADEDFELTSGSFADGTNLPLTHTRCADDFATCFPTCPGENVSPALSWSGVPDGTLELALIVDDPDPFPHTHWLVYGLDPSMGGLEEGIVETDGITLGATGIEDSQAGWLGPCPPPGDGAHTYVFTLYALDTPLQSGPGATAEEVRAAIAEHTVATTNLATAVEART